MISLAVLSFNFASSILLSANESNASTPKRMLDIDGEVVSGGGSRTVERRFSLLLAFAFAGDARSMVLPRELLRLSGVPFGCGDGTRAGSSEADDEEEEEGFELDGAIGTGVEDESAEEGAGAAADFSGTVRCAGRGLVGS